ncbi:DNA mismatch repair protein MutL [Clostridium baratii]|uniref:DNA mismatch repair endonuclease MutL n=1 Tax=Clostridium baratii TaxID=1561 RepID=UPI0009A27ADA|nr:DNA mismatch repair endonuclease MutL [Clostridium baratii]OPF51659.1 DNA mismatch repair protein MutL [Clostridium baratii]OPF55269.1 DNA mismatch repair protein MutL [Clostridium baratii]OPF57552.1 DNA mismatch repair protein MutL [Clostridium baratii]OPF60350.1 DNA mismatch repair protein MutL [Clostridium baratii]
MKRINLLDENTSNKIAAGEVVERPSSVVKELVENSIDANSKNITIEIEDGGCSFIKIIDDGDGIHKDDIKKAFLPHATSKIQCAEDIFSINTLGFRGEALASIASVSKVNLKTKPHDSSFGREIIIEGGEILEEKDCGVNSGTTIEVKDLFFNIPARKKFLKSFTREGSIITDIINRISIVNPDISFKLFNNGKKVLHTFGSGNTKDVLRVVYGKKISENLVYFEGTREEISISGYIGKEEIARGSRNNQSIYVNGRYIKNKTLVAAVENAFKSFSTVNKFPFFVLFIDVYPEFVDVNIHPTKAEIKFKDDRMMFKIVFDSVHKYLKEAIFDDFKLPEEEMNITKENQAENLELNIKFEEDEVKFNSFEKNDKIFKENSIDYSAQIKKEQDELLKLKEKLNNTDFLIHENKNDIKDTINDTINDLSYSSVDTNKEAINSDVLYIKEDEDLNKNISIKETIEDRIAKFPPLRIIGQFNKTYIIAEFNETLYLIDQHAAHEKILFEKYIKSISEGSIIIQQLLVPTLIELSTDDFIFYIENQKIFKDAGFTVEEFGGNTISLKEVPYFLGKLDPKDLFLSIIDDLKKMGDGKTIDIKYNKIATMACKKAVKGNDTLTELEMIKLVEDLRFIEDPFHCPHGRPTIIKFTNNDLEKKFRRIV